MNYHDYHLRSYSVSDFGRSVVLNLVYDYPDQPIRQSTIIFSGVVLYHFVHTAKAIITEIESIAIETILSEYSSQIPEWNRLHSVTAWAGSFEKYKKKLEEAGMLAWKINSAIGFHGFVIGKKISQSVE